MRATSRTVALLASLMLGAVAAVVLDAPLAGAHDELQSSSPADDSHLDAFPREVRLEFGGVPLTLGSTILVVDANGSDHVSGPPAFDGGSVSVPLADPADGHFQVRWRVVSGDGAVISGTVDFSVGELSGAPTIPPPRSSDEAVRQPAAGQDQGDYDLAGADVAVPDAGGGSDDANEDPGDSPWRRWAVGGGGAAVALASAFAFRRATGVAPHPAEPAARSDDHDDSDNDNL